MFCFSLSTVGCSLCEVSLPRDEFQHEPHFILVHTVLGKANMTSSLVELVEKHVKLLFFLINTQF